MSSSRALCCLPSVKKEKHYFFFSFIYSKTIIRFSFCDIQNNEGLGKGYPLTSTLSSSNNCLIIGYPRDSHDNKALSWFS